MSSFPPLLPSLLFSSLCFFHSPFFTAFRPSLSTSLRWPTLVQLGLGERCELPSGPWPSLADKRFLVHSEPALSKREMDPCSGPRASEALCDTVILCHLHFSLTAKFRRCRSLDVTWCKFAPFFGHTKYTSSSAMAERPRELGGQDKTSQDSFVLSALAA